jgi:hypothetical protein
MLLSKISLGLASISLIAMAGLPALADGATTRQTAVQENTLSGNGNRAVSRSRQTAIIEQQGSRQDTATTTHTVEQTTTIEGDNNFSSSISHQTAITRQGRGR